MVKTKKYLSEDKQSFNFISVFYSDKFKQN